MELFRKNCSVTFEEIRNKIHPLSQAQNATSLFLFVFVSPHCTRLKTVATNEDNVLLKNRK